MGGTLDHTYGLDWTAKSKTNLAYNLLSPAYDSINRVALISDNYGSCIICSS